MDGMETGRDAFGRTIDYLRISVTKRCNLRCAYCMPADGSLVYPRNDILKISEILRLAAIFAPLGVRKVRVTGGEPLVRKGVAALVRGLKRTEGIREVAMTTNGVLLEKMIPALRNAGLDRINISLDSLRRDRVRALSGADVHGTVMRAVHTVAEGGIWPLKINVVAIRGFNDDEIEHFAGLANHLPIEVRFIEMMPTAHNRLFTGKACIPTAEIENRIRGRFRLVSAPRALSGGPAVVYNIEGGAGRVGFVSPLSRHFCGGCNRLRLTAEGNLRSCLFSDGEISLREGFLANAPDEWFAGKFHAALAAKPRGHNLSGNPAPPCATPMAAIGG